MKNLILISAIFLGTVQADFWDDTKAKTQEYLTKAQKLDKEYNVTNQVKANSGKIIKKAKELDKEHKITDTVKEKAKSGWQSFKSLF